MFQLPFPVFCLTCTYSSCEHSDYSFTYSDNILLTCHKVCIGYLNSNVMPKCAVCHTGSTNMYISTAKWVGMTKSFQPYLLRIPFAVAKSVRLTPGEQREWQAAPDRATTKVKRTALICALYLKETATTRKSCKFLGNIPFYATYSQADKMFFVLRLVLFTLS